MTPMELIPLLDKGMVEELRMYYNGHHSVVDIRNIPATMPDYQIVKMWNSENGKGISVLLADNMAEDPEVKKNSWNAILHDALERYDAMKKEENEAMHVEEYRDKLIEVFHKSGHDELIALVPQAKNDEIEIMEQILKDWPYPPYNSNKGGK